MVHIYGSIVVVARTSEGIPTTTSIFRTKVFKKILVNHQQFNSAKEENNILRNFQFVATTHTHATNSYILYGISLLF